MPEDAVRIQESFRRCAAGSPPDCDTFFHLVYPLLRRVVGRIALQYSSTVDVEDIVQEVTLRVSANSAAFARLLPDQPAAVPAYFAVVASNSARDWFRARGAEKRGGHVTNSLDDPVRQLASRIGLDDHLDRGILIRQIEEALDAGPRETTVFRLYYRQGYSAREIAEIPAVGLNIKGVESLIRRLTLQIQEKLQLAKGKRRGAASSS